MLLSDERAYEVVRDLFPPHHYKVQATTVGQAKFMAFSGDNAEWRAERYAREMNDETTDVTDLGRIATSGNGQAPEQPPEAITLEGIRIRRAVFDAPSSDKQAKGQVVIEIQRDHADTVKALIDLSRHATLRLTVEPVDQQATMDLEEDERTDVSP